MLAFCADRGMDMTVIEVMPMGDIDDAERLDQYWHLSDVEAQLADRFSMTDLAESTGGPARYKRINETWQKVGFITPLTHNFCESCNRVRLTCTGQLFQCLGQEGEFDLRRVLRESNDDQDVITALHKAVTLKPRGHDFDYSRQNVQGRMTRHMSHTGG